MKKTIILICASVLTVFGTLQANFLSKSFDNLNDLYLS